MSTTAVAEIAPAKTRKRIYVAFAVASATTAGGLAGFASIATTAPSWLIFVSAFVNVVGTGLGFIAAGNTPAGEAASE